MNTKLLTATFAIILAFVGYVYYFGATSIPADESWLTYRSEAYGFEMQYPVDWEVYEIQENYLTGINFYPRAEEVSLPLTHHSAATHISVFPEGIGTEGVFSEQSESGVQLGEKPENIIDFILSDGTPWGTFANNFAGRPSTWESYGFIWAGLRIQDHTITCRDSDGNEIIVEFCDPLGTGLSVIHNGAVDAELRETQLKMLQSFRFI